MKSPVDTRVLETRKFSRTSFLRTAGRFCILFSYYSPVAIYDRRDKVMSRIDKPQSHTTRCHLGRFRREMQPETIEVFPEHIIQERIYSYLAKRARRLAERNGAPKTLDDRAVDRIDANVISEGVKSSRPQSITIPLGVAVTFVKPE